MPERKSMLAWDLEGNDLAAMTYWVCEHYKPTPNNITTWAGRITRR